MGGSVRTHIFCGSIVLYDEARVEAPGGCRLTWPVVVAPDYASVVRTEVELENVSNIGGGVCWVKEWCSPGGLDDYYFGSREVWTCQGHDDE